MTKIIQRVFCSLLSVILFAPLFMGCDKCKVVRHTFSYDEGAFYLDSTRFVIGSVELTYARVPKGYWQHRMEQARAMGANTILVRVPWMLHEEQEGVFDFSGEMDIREFCRLAQENGLFVWLHAGPFVDADMEFGGMPWWLLKNDKVALRSHHSNFMGKVGRFYRALSQQLADMQVTKGGPIILVNVEEPMEQPRQKAYLAALADSLRTAGFDETLLTTMVKRDKLLSVPDGMLAAIVIDEEQEAKNHFSGIKKRDTQAPVLCGRTEISCDHIWGEGYKMHNYNKRYMRAFEVFNTNGSMNIAYAIGGTSFGHLAGATFVDSLYVPYATSYNNASIIAEGGVIGKEAERFAQLYKDNATQLNGVVYSPEYVPLIMPQGVQLQGYLPLQGCLSTPLQSQQPLSFEKCNVGYGAVLYETLLSDVPDGVRLRMGAVHDNAQIMLNGRLVACVTRSAAKEDVLLEGAAPGDTLRILVDAYGRVAAAKDYKGLIGAVELVDDNGNATELQVWSNYALPSHSAVDRGLFKAVSSSVGAGYYRASFKCDERGDFYIYTGNWGRGEAWINGHSLGRYSAGGPQRTLYVPGCWLNEDGDNELLILDWVGVQGFEVECFKNSLL